MSYTKQNLKERLSSKNIDDVDSEDDDETDPNIYEQGLSVTIDRQPTEIVSTYNEILKKSAKVVKIFRRSPTKDDMACKNM